MSEMHKWETIRSSGGLGNVDRFMVPGGWIYTVVADIGEVPVFVPAPPRLVALELYVRAAGKGDQHKPGHPSGVTTLVLPSAVFQISRATEPVSDPKNGNWKEAPAACVVELDGPRDEDGAPPCVLAVGTPAEVAAKLGLRVREGE